MWAHNSYHTVPHRGYMIMDKNHVKVIKEF